LEKWRKYKCDLYFYHKPILPDAISTLQSSKNDLTIGREESSSIPKSQFSEI
jgi:hypothetical protein